MKGEKIMCSQMKVLEKIRKKGKVNGYDVELAEAQAEDFVRMKKRIVKIESNVNAIKLSQAEQTGMLKTIMARLDGPSEQERKDGIIWTEIRKGLKTWKFWCVFIFVLLCIGLAGQRVMEVMRWIPTGV